MTDKVLSKEAQALVERVKAAQQKLAGMTTPKQLAGMLGGESTGWTGKKIRRLLRDGKLSGSLISGRWYLDPKQVDHAIDVATGKVKTS